MIKIVLPASGSAGILSRARWRPAAGKSAAFV